MFCLDFRSVLVFVGFFVILSDGAFIAGVTGALIKTDIIMNNILRTLAAAVLVFAGAIGTSALAQTPDSGRNVQADRADSRIVDAVQKYENDDYAGAKALLDIILKSSPDNDAAWYYRGLCNMRLKNAADSERDLKQAVVLDSTNYWYRYMLAGLYGMTGRTILTIDMYESLLRDFPKKSDLYYGLANLYINQGQTDKALKTIGDIETQFGKSDATVMTRFNILTRQNRNEEAYKALEEYNKEYSSPQVLSMLGDYEMSMYNDSSAVAYYDEALSLDRSYAPALLGKAEAYRMTRDYASYFRTLDQLMADTEASPSGKSDYLQAVIRQSDPRFIKSFTEQLDTTVNIAIGAHPADSSILQTAGLYYLMTDRKDKAAGAFRTVMKEYPDNVGATASYIQALLYMNEWDNVIAATDSALVRFPKEPGFLDFANAAEYNRKNYRAIIENCGKILQMAPGDSAACVSAWSTMGDMYHLLGDQAKTFKAYENALKVAPGYAPVLNNYAYYLAVEGKKLKKAYAMSKKTVEAEPDNATYLDTFGWILYLQGKALEAKPFFKHAMLYGGKDSATVMEHYATVLEALGENDLAKVYRQQAKNKAAEGQE